jgi:hypothetical protein
MGRLGVTHVLAGGVPADPTARVPALRGGGPMATLARVRWGPQELVRYGLPAGASAEPAVSPVAAVIDYHPGSRSSRPT